MAKLKCSKELKVCSIFTADFSVTLTHLLFTGGVANSSFLRNPDNEYNVSTNGTLCIYYATTKPKWTTNWRVKIKHTHISVTSTSHSILLWDDPEGCGSGKPTEKITIQCSQQQLTQCNCTFCISQVQTTHSGIYHFEETGPLMTTISTHVFVLG